MSNEALRQMFADVLTSGGTKSLSSEAQQCVEKALAEQVAKKVDEIRDERRRAFEVQKNLLLA